MDTLETVLNLITPDMYMASMDLQMQKIKEWIEFTIK